jgi:hypothetical protein
MEVLGLVDSGCALRWQLAPNAKKYSKPVSRVKAAQAYKCLAVLIGKFLRA